MDHGGYSGTPTPARFAGNHLFVQTPVRFSFDLALCAPFLHPLHMFLPHLNYVVIRRVFGFFQHDGAAFSGRIRARWRQNQVGFKNPTIIVFLELFYKMNGR
jgi:hypothetical protein